MPIRDKNIQINLSLSRSRNVSPDTRSRLPERLEEKRQENERTYRDRSPRTSPKRLEQKENRDKGTIRTKESFHKISTENSTDKGEGLTLSTNKNEESFELEKDEKKEDTETRSEENVDGPEVDREMAQIMGFSSFGSTSGSHVEGAKGGGTKIENTSQYRRYMNRKKGFNRPLSPTR